MLRLGNTFKFMAAVVVAAQLCVGAVTVSAAEEQPSLLDQIQMPYEKFTIANGLTVLVHTDHRVPTVFVGMWYGVGSKDEPHGKSGFAHLFEHLMFQQTENRTGEFITPFNKAGAVGLNGTTNEDRTNYYATVPSGAVDMALWMESDRMSYLLGAMSQETLDEQRGVVRNEKRQRENQPYGLTGEFVRKGIYPDNHPYGHSIIGSMDDLNGASLEDVKAWFNQYYGASNAVLVLAGDISLEDAKAKVDKYFGSAPIGVPLVKQDVWVPTLSSNKIETQQDRVPQTRITRVWPIPQTGDRETALLSIVADTLFGNKNAPLRRKLVDELQWATDIKGRARGQDLAGTFSIDVGVRPGVDSEMVLAVLDKELARYLEGGPDLGLLKNAKLARNFSFVTGMENKAAIGAKLVAGELFNDDPHFALNELRWQNEAAANELKSVGQKWLNKPYYQLTVEPFPAFAQAEEIADRRTIPDVGESGEIKFPDVQETKLDNGITLVVAKHGNLPLTNVSVSFKTGAFADPIGATGSAAMTFAMIDKGTENYDAAALSTAMDQIAMQPRIRANGDNASITFKVLTTKLSQSIDLVAEMVRNATFPAEELEKQRNNQMVGLKQLEGNPSGNAYALFSKAIFGEENVRGRMLTPKKLEKLSREDLIEFRNQELQPENMTIFMVGNIALAEAKAAVEGAFNDWSTEGKSNLQPVAPAKPNKARVILVNKPGATQTTVYAGQAVEPFSVATQTTLSMMNTVFGGSFESRVNMNLREDKGWTYGASSWLDQSASSGNQMLYVSTHVQADKTPEAINEILKEYRDLSGSRPVTQAEYVQMVESRIRSLPGLFSSSDAYLFSIGSAARNGLPYTYSESLAERTYAVSLEEINVTAREVAQADSLTLLVIGDLKLIEEKVRALNYGPLEVWDYTGSKVR